MVAKNLAGETLCVSTRGAVQLAQILVVVAAIWMEVPGFFLGRDSGLTPKTDVE